MSAHEQEVKNRVKLPATVRPSKYTLNIHVELTKFEFSGEETVDVEVKQDTNTISVNAKELKISDVQFVDAGNNAVKASDISIDEKKEVATFTFPQTLKAGKGQLKAKFVGVLNDKLKGFYRSKYTVNGQDRYMAVTQFEPIDARRAFPCWDEPNVKATFDVTLVVPKDRLAISNMPIVSETDSGEGLKAVRFGETPIMSTYLLAFIVGEFDFVEGQTPNGIKVRVYTPLGKKEQGQFALEVSVKTLPFYDKYFGIPYPLPKMDLLAIPDFAAGAMENWGCVTYRETALLVDPKTSSVTSKQYVALVVGHELAHQWFGNLVTMDWWTHLWLNEGFASWIEYLAVDHCFPEFDIWTQFVYADLGRAMNLDGLVNSHPVEVPIHDPAEIDEIFDAISYSKGCSIIRMLADWLGTEPFKQGLHNYLKKFTYSNALTEDLWHFLAESSGKPVKELMDSWTKLTGYPVLSVTEVAPSGAGRAFSLTQERFLSSGPAPDDKTVWQVPVGVITSSDPKTPHFEVVKAKQVTMQLAGAKASDWIKFNPAQTGFFRVKYPPALLQKLKEAVQKHELNPIDRLGVQNDILSLAKAGFVSTAEALDVVKAYQNETNFTVWADLASKLAELETVLSNTDFYDQYKAFARSLYAKVIDYVGWEAKSGESPLVAMLRSLVLGRVGRYGDPNTAKEAKRRLDLFLQDRNSLVPDLRAAVYSISLSNFPTNETYEAVLRVFRESDMQEEKVRILRALGTVNDKALLRRTLEFALSSEVRSQDAVFVIESVAANPQGRQLAWDFIRERWADLGKRYEGGFLLTRLIRAAGDFASEDKAQEVEAFFKANPVAGGERTTKQAVESIRSNAKWLQRDAEKIREWLNSPSAKY